MITSFHPAAAKDTLANQVLLSCARIRLDPKEITRLKGLLRTPLDWAYIIRTASCHGVIPLLYQHLKEAGLETIPEDVVEQLRGLYHWNAGWNLLLTSELLRLLALFEAQGIAAVPFKGPALAAFAYGDLSLRQFVDLDLLIHRQDFPKAKELLFSQGYHPKFSLDGPREENLLRFYYHLAFEHRTKGVSIELHWEILRWYQSLPKISSDSWRRLERQYLEGKEIPSFSPEDLLLIVCVHSAVHCWERLAWVCDVAALLGLPGGMDWDKLLHFAARLDAKRMLFVGLCLARDLLGAEVPEKLWQEAQADPTVTSLALQVGEGLFRDSGCLPRPFAAMLFQIRLRDNWRSRIRFCFHTAFTPTDEDIDFVALPRNLVFLYYLLRPVRLMRDLLKNKGQT